MGRVSRWKVVGQLGHIGTDLEPKHSRIVDASRPSDIRDVLSGMGAPETSYVFSALSSLDGQFLPLADAISRAFDADPHGSVVSCVPGKLAFAK